MDKYTVFFSPQAYRDIDETYEYIRTELFAEKAALDLVDDIEDAILSLEILMISRLFCCNHIGYKWLRFFILVKKYSLFAY